MDLGYLLRESWRGISRRRVQFVLTSLVVAACITLLTLSVIVTIGLWRMLDVIARHGEVYAFVTDAAALDYSCLVSQAAALEGVSEVRFVDKGQALEELRADLGEDSDLLNAVDGNPLPASLRLTLSSQVSSPEQLSTLEQKLRLLPGVTEVWSSKEAIIRLSRALRTAAFIDLAMLLLTVISSIFIIFQAVESAIASRRSEIEIMELVGAAPAAVRLPFVLEGAVQGLLGGVTSFLVLLLAYLILRSSVPAPEIPVSSLLLADACLGLLLGVAGSGIALGRRS